MQSKRVGRHRGRPRRTIRFTELVEAAARAIALIVSKGPAGRRYANKVMGEANVDLALKILIYGWAATFFGTRLIVAMLTELARCTG